jgi:radical SAM superfamily enzyme YgiQ (UPF0313 family)
MRVLFLSIYNTPCLGARLLMSNILSRGHEARLVLFKVFTTKIFHYDHPDEMREYREIMSNDGIYPIVEFRVDHEIMSPYPTPITPEEKEILFEEIRDYDPDIVAFTLGSTFVPLTQEISREIKARFPKKMIVWGGIHCIMAPEDGVGYADVICNCEADQVFPEFLEDPYRRNREGFWFCGDKGVDRNPPAPLPQDLDAFPYPVYGDQEREVLIEEGKRGHWMPRLTEYVLITQRGCPFKCTYCFHSKAKEVFKGRGKYLRRRSVKNVLDEIEIMIRRFGYDLIPFWDDLFMIDRKWINEFCDGYKARFPGVPFGAYAHHQFTDREMLERLKDAGCYFTSLGLQSGSRYVLEKVFHRRETPEKIVAFGEMMREIGFPVLFYDILSNSEYEREEDCQATLDLLCRLPTPTKASVRRIQCFPHTEYERLDLPRGGVSEDTFEFYNLLYVLACLPQVDKDWVRQIGKDPYWRKNKEGLRQIVKAIWKANEHFLATEEVIADIRGQLALATGSCPTGVRRATRHLLHELKKSFDKRISRKAPPKEISAREKKNGAPSGGPE